MAVSLDAKVRQRYNPTARYTPPALMIALQQCNRSVPFATGGQILHISAGLGSAALPVRPMGLVQRHTPEGEGLHIAPGVMNLYLVTESLSRFRLASSTAPMGQPREQG